MGRTSVNSWLNVYWGIQPVWCLHSRGRSTEKKETKVSLQVCVHRWHEQHERFWKERQLACFPYANFGVIFRNSVCNCVQWCHVLIWKKKKRKHLNLQVGFHDINIKESLKLEKFEVTQWEGNGKGLAGHTCENDASPILEPRSEIDSWWWIYIPYPSLLLGSSLLRSRVFLCWS